MLKLRRLTTTTTTLLVKNRNLTHETTTTFNASRGPYVSHNCINLLTKRSVSTSLSPSKVTEILSANEYRLDTTNNIGGSSLLPNCIKSIECNQLESNNPIEDRLRIASIQIPGSKEPTLVLGVFDGHGGGTTVDVISRRLFNYIAVSLHPEPNKIDITAGLDELVVDLHNLPPKFNVDPHSKEIELQRLGSFRDELTQNGKSHQSDNIVNKLKASFQRCDDDLSQEIQENLIRPTSLSYQMLRHYLSAAVSGCCAIVTVLHEGSAYVVSVGDCRAVLGVHGRNKTIKTIAQDGKTEVEKTQSGVLQSVELNDEHNCDNINEIRRLAASHPKSEQNTMIKHNRLLGHLMPFRAFGDFNYKWSQDMIKACGITRTFGAGVIPAHYETPPYLIAEPDVHVLHLNNRDSKSDEVSRVNEDKFLIMATDGLWELFESSRDVVEAIVDHMNNASQEDNREDYDTNCATYIMRSALCSGPYPDISSDPERMRKLHHIRLESTLTLPKSVVRNFRDDISIILVKLQ